MRPKNCKQPRRVIRKFPPELVIEEPKQDLQDIIDRMLSNEPTNSDIRYHKPLPPDGENLEDFDTGINEILDLVDQQQYEEELYSKLSAQQKAAIEKQQADAKAEFDKRVEEAVQQRISSQE